MSATEPKIQEIDDEQIEEQPESADGSVQVHNRNERKARKMIAKLNLKKVDGISRVFFRTNRGAMFTVLEPDVYKNPSTGTYIVFGEAKMDNQNANLQNLQNMINQTGGDESANPAAAAAAAAAGGAGEGKVDGQNFQAEMEAAAKNLSLDDKAEDVDDANVDTEGLDEANIKIVMDQANTSKAKAVASLKKNKGDIVNTIMELTA